MLLDAAGRSAGRRIAKERFMFSKILIPLDGSDEAEAALAPATEIAKRFNSSVVLLEVTPGYGQIYGASAAESFGASGSLEAAATVAQAAESAASSYLDSLRGKYGNPDWQIIVGEGGAGTAIADQSKKLGVDLIVMATHARTGLKRLFLGSVADDVIRNVSMPVLVVQMPDEDDDEKPEHAPQAP
jgi:nucleotide-binding universal stress UspA family protein